MVPSFITHVDGGRADMVFIAGCFVFPHNIFKKAMQLGSPKLNKLDIQMFRESSKRVDSWAEGKVTSQKQVRVGLDTARSAAYVNHAGFSRLQCPTACLR